MPSMDKQDQEKKEGISVLARLRQVRAFIGAERVSQRTKMTILVLLLCVLLGIVGSVGYHAGYIGTEDAWGAFYRSLQAFRF